jgi:hypothetical protein
VDGALPKPGVGLPELVLQPQQKGRLSYAAGANEEHVPAVGHSWVSVGRYPLAERWDDVFAADEVGTSRRRQGPTWVLEWCPHGFHARTTSGLMRAGGRPVRRMIVEVEGKPTNAITDEKKGPWGFPRP